MLDDRLRMMLEDADTLTEEDLESLRSEGAVVAVAAPQRTRRVSAPRGTPATQGGAKTDAGASPGATLPLEPTPAIPVGARGANLRRRYDRRRSDAPPQSTAVVGSPQATPDSLGSMTGSSSRGEYERSRTRESKVSTACLGAEREKHAWWPLGTEVVGQIGNEFFTAVVVENAAVKSGRSLKLTSGSAQGRICITPTRAAMEATEAYRQAHNLGRGGGVTNGWLFWQPRTGTAV